MDRHRPGPLKQKNKKHGKKEAGKKVHKSVSKNLGASLGKRDRRNLRAQKRDSAKAVPSVGPRIVLLLGFHADAPVALLREKLLAACGGVLEPGRPHPTLRCPDSQERLTLVLPERAVGPVLDAGKCADLVLGVFPPTATVEAGPFDELGYRLLSCLKLQGLPPVLGVLPSVGGKSVHETRKLIDRFLRSELPDAPKLHLAESQDQVKNLARMVRQAKLAPLTWRDARGYMLVDRASYASGTLTVFGFAKGTGFAPHHPVHITGVGDAVIASAAVCGADGSVLRELAGPAPEAEPRLQAYDPLAAEQTWPSEAELRATRRVRVPKVAGHSNTELAWMGVPAEEEEEEEDSEDSDDGMDEDSDSEEADLEEDEEDEADSLGGDLPQQTEQEMANARKLEFEERAREEMDFPDEVDTAVNAAAQTRFQKYRGLKSLRTSDWDAYEDLPVAYSRIWEFEDFGLTVKAGRKVHLARAQGAGEYVRLELAVALEGPPSEPLVISSVLPHEQQVTVCHAVLHRTKESDESIKSKTELQLECGFRRLPVQAIFAEVQRKGGDKLKFSRYFHPGTTAQAAFYGPAMYAGPVLAWDGDALVAWGSLQKADPLKVIVKRATLTGYPFRCRKRKAVVRYMFFNPTDIKWFKPVELSTKKGLRGHVICSLGTHGYMKCRFNERLKHDDTVCMHLYKRQFPPWFPASWGEPGRAIDA